MNEDVIAEAQAAASDAEIVIESVADVGVVAAKTISETTNTFLNWLKSYCSWENLFKLIGGVIIVFAIYFVYKIKRFFCRRRRPSRRRTRRSTSTM